MAGLSNVAQFAANNASTIRQGVGVIGNYLLDYFAQKRALKYEKQLYDYQLDYKKVYDRMREAGVNPGAALQGISGAAPSANMSQVSPALSNPMNLGETTDKDLTRPSVIASNEASAAASEASAEESRSRKLLNYQTMAWNPRRWAADIRKIQSEIGVNNANKRYLNELANTVEQKRPWEIQTLRYGLVVARAQVVELTSRARLNRASGYNQVQQGDYWSHKAESESYDVFQHKWNQSLLMGGWNPSQPFWENLGRLAFTDPKRAEDVLNNGVDFLDRIDNQLEVEYGKDYQRFKKYSKNYLHMGYRRALRDFGYGVNGNRLGLNDLFKLIKKR